MRLHRTHTIVKTKLTRLNFVVGLFLIAIMVSVCDRAFGSIPKQKYNDTQLQMIYVIKKTVSNPAYEQVFLAMARIESNFFPNAKGPANEIGLFQIKLDTVYNPDRKVHFKCVESYRGKDSVRKALYDPRINTLCAMEYYFKLEQTVRASTAEEVVYAYNGGPSFARENPYNCDFRKKYRRGQACLHVKTFIGHYYSNEF